MFLTSRSVSVASVQAVVVAQDQALILRTCTLSVSDLECVGTYESDVAQPRISDRRVDFGEPHCFFERILGWPTGDGTCWVSTGGDSRFILEDLGNVAGLFDVAVQSDYPRSIVNLSQIMDASSNEDV